jgi:hypothetical protein
VSFVFALIGLDVLRHFEELTPPPESREQFLHDFFCGRL